MNRCAFICLLIFTYGIFLISCQRELYFDVLPSAGTLQNYLGDCFPKTVGGTFKAGVSTADSNFIEVLVHVTRAGDYAVVSDTINGYSFKKAGSFPDTGIYSLKLPAAGKPDSAGINAFTINYDSTQCIMQVIVLPDGSGPAVYTMQGAPDTCFPVTVSGSFIKDVSLNNNDTVTVTLAVSVAGTYTITTSEVNGYKFYGSGRVNTGIQKITLKGIGAPLNAGTDIFSVVAGTSTCTFAVTVTSPVIVTGSDYFPLNTNNYWTYDDLMIAGDTIKRVIADSAFLNGNLYHAMHEYNRYGGDSTFMFRRSGNDYIQYGPVDILTLAVKYIPTMPGEIKILKQNLLSGDNWTSDEYLGDLFSGQPVYLQYNFYCVDANAAITVNNHSFINVYHIVMLPQVRSSLTFPYNSTNEQADLYYAKGIGLVYSKITDNSGFRKNEFKIRYWKVY